VQAVGFQQACLVSTCSLTANGGDSDFTYCSACRKYTSYGVALRFKFRQWLGRIMLLLPLSQEKHPQSVTPLPSGCVAAHDTVMCNPVRLLRASRQYAHIHCRIAVYRSPSLRCIHGAPHSCHPRLCMSVTLAYACRTCMASLAAGVREADGAPPDAMLACCPGRSMRLLLSGLRAATVRVGRRLSLSYNAMQLPNSCMHVCKPQAGGGSHPASLDLRTLGVPVQLANAPHGHLLPQQLLHST
jgi:hypothetical protein